MAAISLRVCVFMSALFFAVHSQDPSLQGGSFGTPGQPGGSLDPGTGFTDPMLPPFQPPFQPLFPPGMSGAMPAPLPRPNPMQAMLPFMLMRGSDMAQMMALMSMLGGGGGGFMSNPLLLMGLLGGM